MNNLNKIFLSSVVIIILNIAIQTPSYSHGLQSLLSAFSFFSNANASDHTAEKVIIKELKIKISHNKILLGSSVTIENLLNIIKDKIPEMIEILKRFGSPLIRNQATIGGNLCTSSPIGDLAPVLLVLDSRLNIFGKDGARSILLKDFFKGYRKNVLKKDQILVSIEIRIPQKNNKLFFWKLSKRFDQDISTISLAININTQNHIIKDLHIAAGGIAEIPKYLDGLSRRMINKNIDEAIKLAIDDIDNYIDPISDLRGTSEYRKTSFKGLFRRLQQCLDDNVKNM